VLAWELLSIHLRRNIGTPLQLTISAGPALYEAGPAEFGNRFSGCPLPGDSFLRRVYWARLLVSSSSFRICIFSLEIRSSRRDTGCSFAARPPAATKAPDSCSGRLIPPPCNAGMSRSGCPAWATLEELVAEKARSGRSSCSRRSCLPLSALRSIQELRPGSS